MGRPERVATVRGGCALRLSIWKKGRNGNGGVCRAHSPSPPPCPFSHIAAFHSVALRATTSQALEVVFCLTHSLHRHRERLKTVISHRRAESANASLDRSSSAFTAPPTTDTTKAALKNQQQRGQSRNMRLLAGIPQSPATFFTGLHPNTAHTDT